MLNKFEQFIKDTNASEMFITGSAGTGKTTALGELLNYCLQEDINAVVCAYTHKACTILEEKLPAGTSIATLHSILRKRPMINDQAIQPKHIEVSRQHANPEEYQLMFVDEFSMVGEQDYMDIIAMQDPEDEDTPPMKVVYIGDLNQLPPVGDMQTIIPSGDYWVKLTKIHRQKNGNQLLDTLSALVNMIEGAPPTVLESNKNFIRNIALVPAYKEAGEDKVLLAYTNERVEILNAQIAGKEEPEHNDELFSPSTRQMYLMDHEISSVEVEYIQLPFGDRELHFNSKYKTLEYLVGMPNIKFMQVYTMEDGEYQTLAYVFGHYQYKLMLEELKREAAASNRDIEQQFKQSARTWAGANPHHKMARARAKAWRNFLTFKECVHCIDFPYAMTVHKSQGSTYDTVFIDTDDLYKCARKDFNLYLKLLYVAISRSSNMVYTN